LEPDVAERIRILTPEKAATLYPAVDQATNKLPETKMPTSYPALQTQVNSLTADPTNALSAFWIPASPEWSVVTGTPTFGLIASRLPGWTFPKSDCRIAFATDLPSHWTKMKAEVVWVNLVANTGTVSFGLGKHEWAIGDTINGTPLGFASTGTANATPLIASSTSFPEATSTSSFAINPAKMQSFRLERNGTTSTQFDTLPNSIAVLGLIFSKVA
jgi:hypothetical protein